MKVENLQIYKCDSMTDKNFSIILQSIVTIPKKRVYLYD